MTFVPLHHSNCLRLPEERRKELRSKAALASPGHHPIKISEEGFASLWLYLLISFCDVAMMKEELPPQLLPCKRSILRTVVWYLTGNT